jgi:hypothetical protein
LKTCAGIEAYFVSFVTFWDLLKEQCMKTDTRRKTKEKKEKKPFFSKLYLPVVKDIIS